MLCQGRMAVKEGGGKARGVITGCILAIWLGWWMAGAGWAASQPVTLLEEGRSGYQIVVDAAASASEVYAAEELQSHFKACTGVTLPISRELPGAEQAMIVVGFGAATGRLGLPETDGHLAEQACIIKTVEGHLVIAGTRAAGTLHGVHRFLEEVLGVRWYTPDVTKTPPHRNLVVPDMDRVVEPSFLFRQCYCAGPGGDAGFGLRLGYNAGEGTAEDPQGQQYAFYRTCHSYFLYVSPEEFFDAHPEYFSEIGGQRIREETQLCLSNPEVLEIVTRRVLEAMRAQPHTRQFNFSQMDYYNYCQCPQCRAINERYQTNGGTQFWFVNQLAERTSREFPDRLIGTLAYTFTEEPPQGMKMHPNAAVWLCHMFPCCDSHPVAECPLNADHKRRVETWSKLCSHLYIWHYIVNFAHYYNPFPNFRAMAADVKFYQSVGAEGIFLQGMGPCKGGEFALLRGHYGQKLLWDAGQDAEALLADFLEGYYGAAAPALRQYIALLQDKVDKDNIHMHLYTNPAQGYLTDEILAEAESLFDQAEAQAAKDAVLLERVKVARMPLQYAGLFPRNGYTIRGRELRFNGQVAGPAAALDFIQRMRKHEFSVIREYGGEPEQLLLFAQLFSNPVGVVVLENDSLRLDIVPLLGGRVLRIVERKTGQSVTAYNVKENLYYPFAGGLGNFVGGNFNPCGFLEPGIVTASDARSVTMVTTTLDGFQLTRTMELEEGKPTVRIINKLTNPSEKARTAQLRSNLMLEMGSLGSTRVGFVNRGGQSSAPDVREVIGRLREGMFFAVEEAPEGSWSFTGDKGLRVVQAFDREQVDFTWLCAYPEALGELEVELWAVRRTLGPNESVELRQSITVERIE
ncbi:MAG: hypothetical protein BWY71_00563 [Planctomycetes bacterium ADurb.Bin412]|nr:MAG: hypothetical protein BWY71_00563 [Planctomycetes bacterium ADurb.Bin412]